jgi:hypothetical protein
MKRREFYTIPFVWDRTLWVVTFAFFGLWIGLSGWLLYKVFVGVDTVSYLTQLILLSVISLPTIIACEGLAPQRLEISADGIVILRRYMSVAVHREEIKSIEPLSKNDIRGAIRTCGVGGLFGYFGNYYTRKIGSFKLYATNFQNLYLIRKWNGKSIVISCAEPDKMEWFIKQ